MGRPGEGQRTVSEEDVSVYVVDPREKEPDLKELQKQYKNQDCCNQHSEEYEEELAQLAELWMKEESATELSGESWRKGSLF